MSDATRASGALSSACVDSRVLTLPGTAELSEPPDRAAHVSAHWPREHRSVWISAIAVAAFATVWLLALRLPLLDPDEGLHAAIAQEMLTRGDYLTPTFLGQPFFDKPILFFWAQMASMGLLGQHEAAVRLPGLIFGLFGAITTGLLAAQLFGRRAGLLAAGLYATMLLPMAETLVSVHDVALVPWTNLALLQLLRADRASTRRAAVLALAVAAGCCGLAILTKGLSGVAIVSVAAGGVLIVSRRLTMARLAAVASCVGAGVLIAAPWYLAMERAHPGYLHYYFVERHLLGYVAATARHAGKPWLYYVPVLIGGGFPWVAYLAATLWGRGRVDRAGDASPSDAERRGVTAVWIWLLSGLLFLTIGRVKLWTYALPLFPAIAILAAVSWSRQWQASASPGDRVNSVDPLHPLNPVEHANPAAHANHPAHATVAIHAADGRSANDRSVNAWSTDDRPADDRAANARAPHHRSASEAMRWAVFAHALLGAALLPATLLFARRAYGLEPSTAAAAGALIIAAGYGYAHALFRRGRPAAAFAGLSGLFVATVVIVQIAVMPSVSGALSEQELAGHFNRAGQLPARVSLIDDRVGSFAFYLDPTLRRELTPARVRSIGMGSACDEIALAPPDALIAVRERRSPRFVSLLQIGAVEYARAGQFRLYAAGQLQQANAACAPQSEAARDPNGDTLPAIAAPRR